MKGLHIFTRDHRLNDNTSLVDLVKKCDKIITIFIFTPEQVINNSYKSDKSIQFMIESLSDLEESIKQNNGTLFCFQDNYEKVVEKIIKSNDIEVVSINKDYTPYAKTREKKINKICEKNNCEFICNYDYLLTEPGEILSGDGGVYKKFTPFYNNAVKKVKPFSLQNPSFKNKIMREISKPGLKHVSLRDQFVSLIEPDPQSKLIGGRDEGQKKLIALKNQKDYTKKHNFLNYQTSLLAAYTKYGCISIREVFNKAVKELGKNGDFVRQLFWRDFYTLLLNEYPHLLGASLKEKYDKLKWINNNNFFNAWKNGKTGYPIVDANMRALNTEGWMHNRGRLIVASFLIKTLGTDWQKGEKYFATKLIDYDVAVNNGNWQWVAGTGADAQPYFRIFNPWSQSENHDPDATYIKKWIPELENLEPKIIHNWYKYANEDEYKEYAKKYGKPIVDYSDQKDKILKMYKSVFS